MLIHQTNSLTYVATDGCHTRKSMTMYETLQQVKLKGRPMLSLLGQLSTAYASLSPYSKHLLQVWKLDTMMSSHCQLVGRNKNHMMIVRLITINFSPL